MLPAWAACCAFGVGCATQIDSGPFMSSVAGNVPGGPLAGDGATAGAAPMGVAGAGAGGSASGAGGSATIAGSGGSLAGAASAGTGNVAGSAGSAGSGTAGSAGSGGAPVVVDELLSRGKAASADSEEGNGEHPAAHGNDDSSTTRWCAANSATGHYWQVDLGQRRTLSKIEVSFEKAAVYRFKVEGSADGTTFGTPLLDQTNTNDSTANRSFALESSPQARWVRITVTGLPNTTTWASFFDFSVYGH